MGLDGDMPAFRVPSLTEKLISRMFGLLVGWGMGPPYIYLLEVRGRKTGHMYSAPVNLLEFQGKPYLVSPRGRTQWVRNAEAAGKVSLKKGKTRLTFHVRVVPSGQRGEILRLYLENYASAVQKFFPVPDGSDLEDFEDLARHYPVFELLMEHAETSEEEPALVGSGPAR
jgi:deazaflavin-dependent oxidoreductase (nitroreductase family)